MCLATYAVFTCVIKTSKKSAVLLAVVTKLAKPRHVGCLRVTHDYEVVHVPSVTKGGACEALGGEKQDDGTVIPVSSGGEKSCRLQWIKHSR